MGPQLSLITAAGTDPAHGDLVIHHHFETPPFNGIHKFKQNSIWSEEQSRNFERLQVCVKPAITLHIPCFFLCWLMIGLCIAEKSAAQEKRGIPRTLVEILSQSLRHWSLRPWQTPIENCQVRVKVWSVWSLATGSAYDKRVTCTTLAKSICSWLQFSLVSITSSIVYTNDHVITKDTKVLIWVVYAIFWDRPKLEAAYVS